MEALVKIFLGLLVLAACIILVLALFAGIQMKHAELMSMAVFNVHNMQYIGKLETEDIQTNYDPNDFKTVTGYDQFVRFTLRPKDDQGNVISDGHSIPNSGVKKKLSVTKRQYDDARCSDMPVPTIVFLYWPPSLFAQENGQTVAYTIRAVTLSCNGIQFGPNTNTENTTLIWDELYNPSIQLPDPKKNPLLQLDCNLFNRGQWQTHHCELGWQYSNFLPASPGPDMTHDPATGKRYDSYCVFTGTKGLYMYPEAWGKCVDGPFQNLK